MTSYFLYSFFIISAIYFHPAFGMERQCIATTCNRYTQAQVVRQLWNAITNPTPLGIKLANVIISMSRNLTEPDHKLNTIFGQSLWSMNVYTDFQPDNLSISCIFERILHMTILDDEFEKKEYNEAISNYGALVRAVRNFTIRSSLARFSCPTSNPTVTQYCPQECINGSIVNLFLEKYESTLPPYLVSLIASLNKSQNVKDRTVAIIICAISTEPLNGLFQCLLETPEMLKVMQLKACDVPILPCCCKNREEDFRTRYIPLDRVTKRLLKKALKK